MNRIVRLQIIILLMISGAGFALAPENILVIANNDVPASQEIAEYYCQKRDVPSENILSLSLGKDDSYEISRSDYNELIVKPVKDKLRQEGFSDKIECLLTVYGVPVRVGPRGELPGSGERKQEIRRQIKEEKKARDNSSGGQAKQHETRLRQLQQQLDRIEGRETGASVDSELSMVQFEEYELYRWQKNTLRWNMSYADSYVLMVSRLDAPTVEVARGLVDKAIKAEENGLEGKVYVDKGYSRRRSGDLFKRFEKSLNLFALRAELRESYTVVKDEDEGVFQPGECPETALYCGWYSLKNYVDAFDYVDGAIGYHISSLEAVDLRDANSSQWCPAMLMDGITATLGAVREPYLHTFPLPDEFFSELFEGKSLVEAYYSTKPFNSWQLVLVGDPLYTPFEKKSLFE